MTLEEIANTSRAFAKNTYELLLSQKSEHFWVSEELLHSAEYHDAAASVLKFIVHASEHSVVLNFDGVANKEEFFQDIIETYEPPAIYDCPETFQDYVSYTLLDDLVDDCECVFRDIADGDLDVFVPSARDRYMYQAFSENFVQANREKLIDGLFGTDGLDEFWQVLMTQRSYAQMSDEEKAVTESLMDFVEVQVQGSLSRSLEE